MRGQELVEFIDLSATFVELLEIDLEIDRGDMRQQVLGAAERLDLSALDVDVEDVEPFGRKAKLGEQRVESLALNDNCLSLDDRRRCPCDRDGARRGGRSELILV